MVDVWQRKTRRLLSEICAKGAMLPKTDLEGRMLPNIARPLCALFVRVFLNSADAERICVTGTGIFHSHARMPNRTR